jgi:GTP-binding protein
VKLLSADFVTSAAAGGAADGIPRDGLPRVALVGRSNVGKSSLLNALCRRRIARTAAAPGKTRLANVYRASLEGGPGGPGRWSVYLVDLPGYGYARGGAASAQELRATSEAYFGAAAGTGTPAPVAGGAGAAKRQTPGGAAAALLLVDSRHPGLDADIAAAGWLGSLGITRHVVATKIDKLTRAERTRNIRALERILGTAVLPVSAASGEGLDELWQMIANLARR